MDVLGASRERVGVGTECNQPATHLVVGLDGDDAAKVRDEKASELAGPPPRAPARARSREYRDGDDLAG